MKPQWMEIYVGLRNHSLGTNGTNMPSIVTGRDLELRIITSPPGLFRRAFNITSMNNSQLGL